MKHFVLLIATFFLINAGKAQSLGCAGAVDLNIIPQFMGGASLVDPNINYGCITGNNTYYWYGFFKVCQGGTLTMHVGSSTSSHDLDVVAWGPFTTTSNICSNLTAGNIVGCAATAGSGETVNLGTVNTNEIYMVAISCDSMSAYPSASWMGTAVVSLSCSASMGCMPSAGFEMLCMVTVDSATQEYKMVWNELAGNPAAYFGIMKTDQFGVQQQIDTVHVTSLSEYIDYSADPAVHTEQYQIITYDTCGTGWSSMGSFIMPVFCQSSLSTQNTVNVQWTSYIDNAAGYGPQYYVIYRGATLSNMTPLDTVGAFINNYTDINPLSGTAYYKIGVALSAPCVPMRVINPAAAVQVSSFSNAAPVTVVGIEENSLSDVSVFPNPANDVININGVWEQSVLNIYDVTGRLILTQTVQNSAAQQVDLSSLEQGMYVMTIENEHGYFRKEITVQR